MTPLENLRFDEAVAVALVEAERAEQAAATQLEW